MAREEDVGPRPLSWSLRVLAARVRRVDLVGLGAVEAAWPKVDAAVASGARPLKLANDELTVVVASGAHAARARRDADAMLRALGDLLDDAPRAIRVVVRPG